LNGEVSSLAVAYIGEGIIPPRDNRFKENNIADEQIIENFLI